MNGDPLATLLAAPGEAIPLTTAAILVAADHWPELDMDQAWGAHEQFVTEGLAFMSDATTPAESVASLNDFFFGERGLRGDVDSYYDPLNGFLPAVIERGLGIPVTLCALYMDLAGAAGLHCFGIGLPGHFIVRVGGIEDGIYVDPFRGREAFDVRECRARVRRTLGVSAVPDEVLAPRSERQILSRLLLHLKRIYIRGGQPNNALLAVERLLQIRPGLPQEIRDRGALRFETGGYWAGIRDMRRYLELVPKAEDRMLVETRILEMSREAVRLN